MNTNGTELLLKNEVYRIIGAAFEVLKGVGHGLHEKIYENALTVEFNLRGICFEQQPAFPVIYQGAHVGEFVPDLIAFGSIVVDAKVIDKITDHERGQILNYLRTTKLRVGILANFKQARLERERVVL